MKSYYLKPEFMKIEKLLPFGFHCAFSSIPSNKNLLLGFIKNYDNNFNDLYISNIFDVGHIVFNAPVDLKDDVILLIEDLLNADMVIVKEVY